MTDQYTVEIEKVRDDKIEVVIASKYSARCFSIVADKDGLNINADDVLVILPESASSVRVDYLVDYL